MYVTSHQRNLIAFHKFIGIPPDAYGNWLLSFQLLPHFWYKLGIRITITANVFLNIVHIIITHVIIATTFEGRHYYCLSWMNQDLEESMNLLMKTFSWPELPRFQSRQPSSRIHVLNSMWHCSSEWALQGFLVVQWLRILLPVQGTSVWSLVWEDSMHRATKAHVPQLNHALEPLGHSY